MVENNSSPFVPEEIRVFIKGLSQRPKARQEIDDIERRIQMTEGDPELAKLEEKLRDPQNDPVEIIDRIILREEEVIRSIQNDTT